MVVSCCLGRIRDCLEVEFWFGVCYGLVVSGFGLGMA
jgi:hypothetical protein